MKYLHTMIRVSDIDAALDFFVGKLGMVETRRKDVPEGKFTLIFLAADQDLKQAKACLLYTSPSPRDMRRSRMPSSA